MPTPTTADVLSQYRAELAKMEAAGIPNQDRYNDYQQRINELEYKQYEENKARDAKDKASSRPFKKGGTLKLKSGGKVKGCGCAQRGVRKCKMY